MWRILGRVAGGWGFRRPLQDWEVDSIGDFPGMLLTCSIQVGLRIGWFAEKLGMVRPQWLPFTTSSVGRRIRDSLEKVSSF